MLKDLKNVPADIAALGARTHSILAHGQEVEIRRCFERDDWRCHKCGFRLRGFMEVDHIGPHQPCDTLDLRTICQFCHNLRHPVWSCLRGRIRLIWAPSLSQEALNRMAWQVLLASQDGSGMFVDDELADAAREVVSASLRRGRMIASILGTSHPGGLIEAMFATGSICGPERIDSAIDRIDRIAKFWPVAADRIFSQPATPSASFSRWEKRRFVDITELAIAEYWQRETTLGEFRELCAAQQAVMYY